jgi:hypothetical protein
MVNKKGIIRIIEASIAILIIFAALLLIIGGRKAPSEQELSEIITPLLEEIARDTALREGILSGSVKESDLEIFVGERIKDMPYLSYKVKICDYNLVCSMDIYPKDAKGGVYAGGRIISSSLYTKFNPKNIQIFMWTRK